MDLPISAGAAVDPERSESIGLTVLVTRRCEEVMLPKIEVTSKSSAEMSQEQTESKAKRRKKFVAAQAELEFDKTPSRFARSSPSVRGAEDLDRPTFQRKGIKLRV